MWSCYCGNAKEDKDESLTHTAPHLQEVLYSGVRLVGNVGLHIGPHDHTTCNEPTDTQTQTFTVLTQYVIVL